MNLDVVANELYALPPAQFTTDRDQRVKLARAAGDRPLAEQISQLRKPTVSAWLANLLAREHSAEVAALVELGAAMRAAQLGRAGDDIRSLSRRRDRAVRALVRAAQRAAGDRGQQVSAATRTELEQTLLAALTDEAAAALLIAGRISAVLRPAPGGFGFGLGSDAGAATPGRAARPAPAARAPTQAADRPAQAAARQAEADAADAARALAAAEEAVRQQSAAAAAVQAQSAAAATLLHRAGELEAELFRVRAEESPAQRELRRLKAQLAIAGRRAEQAARQLAKAQSRLAAGPVGGGGRESNPPDRDARPRRF